MTKVGIQGIKASFHDVASRQYFNGNPFEVVECETFANLGMILNQGQVDYAVMAIENTIAGSLLPNYLMLENYHFKIMGEVYLRIKLNLLALPGSEIEQLKFVSSHPIAIQQSMDFLMSRPHLKILEVNDTAESARMINDRQLKEHAAIASDLAAEIYQLQTLAEEIETNKQNYTRFLIIGNDSHHNGEVMDKASIRFQLKHRPGSLADVLMIFKDHHINLTKIQSVPVLGKPYEYSFHADLEWEDYDEYKVAMEQVMREVSILTHFGEYKKGEKPFA